MDTIQTLFCEVVHEDERDGGHSVFLIIADDTPKDIINQGYAEAGDCEVLVISRPDMDEITKSMEKGNNFHPLWNGFMIDLRGDMEINPTWEKP